MIRQDEQAHLKREQTRKSKASENLQRRLVRSQKKTSSEFLRQDRELTESSKKADLELTRISLQTLQKLTNFSRTWMHTRQQSTKKGGKQNEKWMA